MPDHGRDAADAVRGLAEAAGLPELAKPAAKEVGDALGRSVRVALAPIRTLCWTFEQVETFLNEAVTEKLRNVKSEKIVEPPTVIAGPVYEALRFAGNDEALRDMYATLLATAMDADTVGTAHPSFVEVIRQLSPDEAKLLEQIAVPQAKPLLKLQRGIRDKPGSWNGEWRNLSLYPKTVDLVRPDLVPTYLDNIERLGIIDLRYDENMDDKVGYEFIKQMEPAAQIVASLEDDEKFMPMFVEGHLAITQFGGLFVQACVLPHPISVASLRPEEAPSVETEDV